MTKLVKAKKIAAVSTILSVLGIFVSEYVEVLGVILVLAGIITAIVAYSYGGFANVLAAAGVLAKLGWIVMPFPYDIVTGMMSFFMTIFICLFIPIIPISKAYKEAQKTGFQR